MQLYRVRKTVLTNTSCIMEGTRVYLHHVDKFGTAYFYTLYDVPALSLRKNQMRLVEKIVDNA